MVVAPPGSGGAKLLLAKAVGREQVARVGNQTGGCACFYTPMISMETPGLQGEGNRIVREPKVESYGTVAVFKDLRRNLWALLQLK